MAKKDVMIKDAPLVEKLNGEEKIPISDGSGEPKATNINGIKDFIGDSPILRSVGTGSALQTIEAETFTDKNEYSSTYGQEVNAEASGDYSLALGGDAAATAKRAVAQGHRCIARGETSHAEGHCAVVEYLDEQHNGYGSHAEGYSTIVVGSYSHAEGSKCMVAGSNSHAEGGETGVMADMAHAEGYKTVVELGADGAHAEGNGTIADAKYSHTEGRQTRTWGEGAHAEGTETKAHEDYSHAEGKATKSKGLYSHTEGISTETNAAGAHAEGFETHAKNECSHAEGHGAVASGIYAHAEGWVANAIGEASHAEGQNTRAHQIGSHSEGNNTDAQGPYSHAEGIGTKTNPEITGQHAEGYYNNVTDSVKVIGCGTSDTDRKNAVEVTQDGRVFVKGVGNYDGTSLEAKDLATVINEGGQGGGVSKDYVDGKVAELSEEVSGLSEKVENLPSGESSVFKAIYGETTIEEVTEAYNAGKVIHCDYNNLCYILSTFSSGQAFFTCVNANHSNRLELKTDSRWATSYFTMENVSNKVKTISEASTDTQYPSAKAVYDALQNVEGGSSVFEAVYGTTTFAEIVEARNKGKEVLCKYQDRIARIVQVMDNVLIYFEVTIGSDSQRLVCYPNNRWDSVYINNSHKLETLDNGNAKVTIAGTSAEVVTPQNVGKQGVIRQTQTWTQAADKGNDYVMSNLVRGSITQANIDLFTSAGAVFNEESGYFELNGLTDISYEEMSAIYNAGFKMVEGYWSNNIRTNLFRPCNVYNVDAAQQYGFTGMYANRNCTAEVFKFTEQETYGVSIKNQMYGTYDGCKYLKTFGNGVFFCQDNNISDQAFTQCFSLETIYIRNLKKNISFKDSARLSNASILYMIKQSAATSPIVITLHTDAKARAEADAEIVAALSEKTNVSLASA